MKKRTVRLKDWSFIEVEIRDKDMYDDYIKATPWPINLWSANFPFIWAYSRSSNFKIVWKLVDGLLVTFILTKREQLYLFCLPFGVGNADKLIEVVHKCLVFCSKWNGLKSNKTKVRMINSCQLEYLRQSESFDQIFDVVLMKSLESHYSIDSLLKLEGKEFKNLRRKVNTFAKKYPEVNVRAYHPKDYNKLLMFNKYWEETAGINYLEIIDRAYFKELIKHFKELDQLVFIAELGNRIVGMIAGSCLPNNLAWASLGKTDREFDGLSELLLLKLVQVVNQINPRVELINDGGDLGYEGLRRYKEKFRPVLSLERHKVFLKDGRS